MRTFSAGFTTAKNKKSNAPVTLIKIDVPANGSFPALTLRLSNRSTSGTPGIYSSPSNTWYTLIDDIPVVEPIADPESGFITASAYFTLTLNNFPTALFSPAARFSSLFRNYKMETATVTVYQWFDGESLVEVDMVTEFVGKVQTPARFDMRTCSFDVVDVSHSYGLSPIGKRVNLDDYPQAPANSVNAFRNIVIGDVKNVPALRVRDVAETRLTQVYTVTDTVMNVSDASLFTDSGDVLIDGDVITYTGKTATTLTGCSGANSHHYRGNIVIQDLSDHRFLVSDPDFPILAIDEVYVEEHKADPTDYSLDLPNGEIVFNKRPRFFETIDSQFLQFQFEEADASNNATNPTNAIDPASQTDYAEINASARTLAVKQTTVMPDIGEIVSAKIKVSHFSEEKLPNDTLTVDVVGIGEVGTLSKPATDDVAVVAGSVDFTHSHLDSFLFPFSEPVHFHSESSAPQITQSALSGVSGLLISKNAGEEHVISFADPGPGTWQTVEYGINWEWSGTITGPSTVEVLARNNTGTPDRSYRLWLRSNFSETYSTGGNIDTETNSIKITHNATFISYYVRSAVRVVTMTDPLDTESKVTGGSTSKSGAVTDHSSIPALNVTTEKSTQGVNDFIDITDEVNGDWSWFTDKVVQVKYNGSTDGRTVYIIHVAFEVEYVFQQLRYSERITADVRGVKDDGSGTITGTPSALIERPDHVFKWSVLNALGLDASVIDSTSLNAAGALYAAAIAGGYKFAGVMTNKQPAGQTWNQWGKECRSMFYFDAGLAKLFYRPLNTADGSLTGVKDLTASEIGDDSVDGITSLNVQRSTVEHIANDIDLQYDRDYGGFKGYRAVESVSDTTSITRYGTREQAAFFQFDFVNNQAMAAHLAAFWLADLKDVFTYALFSTFLDQMELERFDIIRLAHDLIDTALTKFPAILLGPARQFGIANRNQMNTINFTARIYNSGTAAVTGGYGVQAYGTTGYGGQTNL